MNETILAADRVAARQFGQTLSIVRNGKVIELTPDEFERALEQDAAEKKPE
jgi:hypothetical protein